MDNFKIFKDRSGEYLAIKQGWNWVAFFFFIIWCLFVRMWALGLMVYVTLFVLGFFMEGFGGDNGDMLFNIICLIAGFVFGKNGNAWRESKLLSLGYVLKATVQAGSKKEAVAQYLKNKAKAHV